MDHVQFRSVSFRSTSNRAVVVLCSNTSWYLFNFRRNLIAALSDTGLDVCTAAPPDEYTERLRPLVKAHYDLDFSSSTLNPARELALLLRFRRMLRDLNASVLLNFTPKPNIYGSLAAMAAGVHVIDNVAGLGSGFVGNSRVLIPILKLLYRAAFRSADCVFFQNPDDHRLFVDHGIADPDRSRLLPGSGVDLDRFAYDPVDRPADGRFRFLFVARMVRAKGVEEFLRAAAELSRRVPGRAKFTLCGSFDIDSRDAVPASIVRQFAGDDIEFAGHVSDILPYLRRSHCVVLPSYYREGVPRSLLEALAVGRPIITTDMPGCRETFTPGNGWLLEPRNVGELVRAMETAIRLPVERLREMGEASRRLAERRFDERLVIDAYLEQITSILAPPVVAAR